MTFFKEMRSLLVSGSTEEQISAFDLSKLLFVRSKVKLKKQNNDTKFFLQFQDGALNNHKANGLLGNIK